jgi:UDP-N-acetylmuramoyl-tripeptide--D-alanyl-D-alanine ligase
LTLPRRPGLVIQRFGLDPVTAELGLPGVHNRLNASAASAVARCFGIGEAEIADAWKRAQPASMRGELIAADDPTRPTIINDAYNANPTSMRAALEVLAGYPSPRWAVLGDMLELGDAARAAHRAIAARAAEVCERCILIGEHFAAACPPTRPGAAVATMTTHRQWSEALAVEIAAEMGADTTLLIKGSRGMALERMLPIIDARFSCTG